MTITVPMVDNTANVERVREVMGDLFQFDKKIDERWH